MLNANTWTVVLVMLKGMDTEAFTFNSSANYLAGGNLKEKPFSDRPTDNGWWQGKSLPTLRRERWDGE